jgi:hypothetical protein
MVPVGARHPWLFDLRRWRGGLPDGLALSPKIPTGLALMVSFGYHVPCPFFREFRMQAVE